MMYVRTLIQLFRYLNKRMKAIEYTMDVFIIGIEFQMNDYPFMFNSCTDEWSAINEMSYPQDSNGSSQDIS